MSLRLRKLQEEAQTLLSDDAPLVVTEEKPSFARRTAHFWALVWKSFSRNRGPVRASALAYTTLLALIPLLALVVSISSSAFIDEEGTKRIDVLLTRFVEAIAPQLNLVPQGDAAEQEMARSEAVSRIKGFIANVNSGKLGATAGLMLIFVVISLLATIEATFNDIWGVRRGRSWLSRVIHYWATLTLGPILLLTALGFASGMATAPYFETTRIMLDAFPIISNLVFMVMPFIIITLTFTALYKQLPNTKVQFKAALIGGLVGGSLWQLNNLASAFYANRVITYSKIYGSLSVIPIFLLGLYFSWLIVLFGAQVAYAFQNRRAYAQEKQAESINQRGREFVALRIMTLCAQRFQAGEKPPTRIEMSELLGVPTQLSCQILTSLVNSKLLVEVMGDETGYAPARPLTAITVEDIIESLRSGQGNDLATNDDAARAVVRSEFERLLQAERQTASSLTLHDLAHRASAATS